LGLFFVCAVGLLLAESVSTACKTGTSVYAATETFMKSRGMSELPPEAVVRNRALSPAPVTVRPGKNRPPFARSVTLQDFPGAGIPHSRRDPLHHTRRLYRSLAGRLGCPKTQLDEPQYFGVINAQISALETREAIDLRTASAVNQNG
jgi:hypothetical protein